jgi:hypothetical protein
MKNLRGLLGLAPLLFLPWHLCAQPWSGIISTSRAVNWSDAGVSGGIPNRTVVCANISAGATAATINSAIASCPPGQVVQLAAGTYSMSTGLVWNNKSNVTVRGAGANSTFLVFSGSDSCTGMSSDACMRSSDVNYVQSPSNVADWTAGYSSGTTTITLSAHTNLKVGSPITLDQLNDSSDAGKIYVCDTDAGGCAYDGPGGGNRTGRAQTQLVTVTACGTSTPGAACTSNTITVYPGLYMPNWSASKSPKAWWATSPIAGDGIENLSMDHTSSGPRSGVMMFNCVGCYVKGVRSISPGRSHVWMWESPRATIRDSYFYGPGGGQQSYGVEPFPSSDTLIENNIFQNIAAPQTMNANCSGCVIAYNFSINQNFTQSATWQQQSIFLHDYTDYILIEGNVGVGIYADAFHGTHHFVTLFRNRYDGFESNNGTTTTDHTNAVILYPKSRYFNIVGNILGSTSRPHSIYQIRPGDSGNDTLAVETIGYDSTGNGYPDDTATVATLMRWGNWDVVTNAVRWCGSSSNTGWSTTCSSTSEVPTGLPLYANAVPGTETLPASFYLSSKPSWWPAAKAWPPIGPDVTGGNIANVGGHAHSIPAQDCYLNVMGGPANGTGPVLTFNASSCYVQTAGNGLAAPTNVTATVH